MTGSSASLQSWISFLRGYGPVNRVDGMYAETIHKLARHYGVAPLAFPHPYQSRLQSALAGGLTNVVLTGTAGDGKTTLCNALWLELTGSRDRINGLDRSEYGSTTLQTQAGPKVLHVIFEFSGWAPERGQPWPQEKLDLLDRFAAAVLDGQGEELFILAANDGKLVQAWDSLPGDRPAKRLEPLIVELLATGRPPPPDAALLFLNLSRMRTADVLAEALDCLLARPEWGDWGSADTDPAYGPTSPLSRNLTLLADPAVRRRLLDLAELLDANGLHVSIRELWVLLVNALLGHAEPAGRTAANDGVLRYGELVRLTAEDRAYEAALHKNFFGLNLTERRREHFAVFRHLSGFRVGLETTNHIDNLIVFGADDPALQTDHRRLLASDPVYGADLAFETLRQAYLEADEERSEAEAFVAALAHERRRLFLRADEAFDPWRLTVFQSAGAYRREVLGPVKAGEAVNGRVLSDLVCGLNRIWTGLLAGDLDRLYISTGLDFSSGRISDIRLHEIPLHAALHGEAVSLAADDGGQPVLSVSLGRNVPPVSLPLHLTRFEFLIRVARGALPSSFSKECYEDLLAFKSKVVRAFYAAQDGAPPPVISILQPGADGGLSVRRLSLAG